MKNSSDYNNNIRAKIFRREEYKINNISEMKKIMRYNNYLNDNFSNFDPSKSISSRADLLNKYILVLELMI